MLSIGTGDLRIAIHEPLDGFYRGTRFDRSGVFDSITFGGVEYAGRWFEGEDPFRHDNVCGPAEEFSVSGFDEAAPGGAFLKIGVGLLVRPDEKDYDRFRLYDLYDAGEWSVEELKDGVAFRHFLPAWYDYRKEIVCTGNDSFEIRHRLDGLGRSLEGEVYNHNFWTLGRLGVGPGRMLDVPFAPEGNWRAQYDSVALSASGLRFSRQIGEGESVFMGDMHAAGSSRTPYEMILREASRGVEITGDTALSRIVFWANHRVACPEPYNAFRSPCRWTVRYRLF